MSQGSETQGKPAGQTSTQTFSSNLTAASTPTVSTTTTVAILDYGIGNLHSAAKGLANAGIRSVLTCEPKVIATASAVVLPGVGHFGSCMQALRARQLDQLAIDAIASGKPFLAICVGMQMLYESSEEAPGVPGLGVLKGAVRRLPTGVKLPHMQWNQLEVVRPTPMLEGLDRAWMYFVHSYAPSDETHRVAVCYYPTAITAAVAQDNLWATQFHPEKSGPHGQLLLQNFVQSLR